MLSIEKRTQLRKLFDAGVCKNKAMKVADVAEATVYRYYTKWQTLKDAENGKLYDFSHLHPTVLNELKIQATMRRMTLYNYVSVLLTTIVEDNLSKSIVDIPDSNPRKKRLVNNANT